MSASIFYLRQRVTDAAFGRRPSATRLRRSRLGVAGRLCALLRRARCDDREIVSRHKFRKHLEMRGIWDWRFQQQASRLACFFLWYYGALLLAAGEPHSIGGAVCEAVAAALGRVNSDVCIRPVVEHVACLDDGCVFELAPRCRAMRAQHRAARSPVVDSPATSSKISDSRLINFASSHMLMDASRL